MDRTRAAWTALAGVVVGFVLLACGGAPSGPSHAVGTPGPDASTTSSVEPAEPATASYAAPTIKDFALKVKTLKKECFGSAGCNVTFRVELTKVSGGDLDPDKTYELTYDIRGGEDSFTNTLEITSDKYSYDDKEFISTKSSKSVLKAVITDVTEQ